MLMPVGDVLVPMYLEPSYDEPEPPDDDEDDDGEGWGCLGEALYLGALLLLGLSVLLSVGLLIYSLTCAPC